MVTMTISKRYTFEAAHRLPRHPGKCKHLHGHSYELEVRIRGQVSLDTGFVLDYGELSRILKPVVECLDHEYLNVLITYPSAEVIAWCIWYYGFDLDPNVTVSVRETVRTSCSTFDQGGDIEQMERLARMPDPETVGPFPVSEEWNGDWTSFVLHRQIRWKGALEFLQEAWMEGRNAYGTGLSDR